MSYSLTNIFSYLFHPQIPRYHISVNVYTSLMEIELNMGWFWTVTEPLELNLKSWWLDRLYLVFDFFTLFVDRRRHLFNIPYRKDLRSFDSVIHHSTLVDHLCVNLILYIQHDSEI